MSYELLGGFIATALIIVGTYFKGRSDGKRSGNDLIREADTLAKQTIEREKHRDTINDNAIDAAFSKLQ